MKERIMSMVKYSPLLYLLGESKMIVLRVFLRNKYAQFSVQELIDKTHLDTNTIRNELKNAVRNEVIQEIKQEKNEIVYQLNQIPEVLMLESVIFQVNDSFFQKLAEKLEKVGTITFCSVMGVFLQRVQDRVDLFLVGDDIQEKKFDAIISLIETELGQPIHYTILTSKDFQYRQNMFDKFVLDVLNHKTARVLIDKTSDSSDNE